MATDIVMDLNTHDIDFTKGGILHTSNLDALGQRLQIALLLRRGEWLPDINRGVPYYQEFFTVKNNKSFIDSFFQNYILEVDGVNGIESYSSEISPERLLTVDVSVITTAGTIENFLIEV